MYIFKLRPVNDGNWTIFKRERKNGKIHQLIIEYWQTLIVTVDLAQCVCLCMIQFCGKKEREKKTPAQKQPTQIYKEIRDTITRMKCQSTRKKRK